MTDSTIDGPARYRRAVGAAALAAAAVLAGASVLLQPDLNGSAAERLAAIHDAGPSAAVSAALFVLGQLPTLVAALAVGHLLRLRAPLLSCVAPTVAAVGAFGHAVFGGVMLVTVVMAGRPGERPAYADLLTAVEAGPVMAFAALGLLGTVLGVLLLALGVRRARLAPAWVPAALVVFVVAEFAGQGLLGHWAAPTSALLYAAPMLRLALAVRAAPWPAGDVDGEPRVRTTRHNVRGMVQTDS